MEREKGPQKRYIDIEGPQYLEKGQNFFDQAPFVRLLAQARNFSRGKLTDSQLREMMLKAAQLLKDANLQRGQLAAYGGHTQDTSARIVNAGLETKVRKLVGRGNKSDPEDLQRRKLTYALYKGFMGGMQRYPFVGEYVVSQRDSHQYLDSGDLKDGADHYPTPKSYGNWVTEKIRRERRVVKLLVHELFEDTPLEQARPLGDKSQRRTWRILKNEEIAR